MNKSPTSLQSTVLYIIENLQPKPITHFTRFSKAAGGRQLTILMSTCNDLSPIKHSHLCWLELFAMASTATSISKILPAPKYTGEYEELPSHTRSKGPRILGKESIDEKQIALTVSDIDPCISCLL